MSNPEIFKKFIRGNSSRMLIFSIVPVLNIIFYGLLYIAGIIFPQNYNIFTNTISDLGSPLLNPIGWYLFSIAFSAIGILMPFIYIYMHKRLYRIFKIVTIPGTFFLFLSSLGLILLSIFSNSGIFINIHYFSGIFSFACFVTGYVFYWFAIIKYIIGSRKKNRPIKIIGISFMIFVLLFIVISMGFARIYQNDLIFCFLEWILLLTISFQTLIFVDIIPDRTIIEFYFRDNL
jgi:hypothetical protein